MNAVMNFANDRHFWSGVAVALVATAISVFLLVPNLLRARFSAYDTDRISEYDSTAPARSEAKGVTALSASSRVQDTTRKTISSGSMDIVVKSPRDTSEKIRQLAEGSGGFLVSSELYGDGTAASSSLTIRVPAQKFAEIRSEIRNLGLRVENEKLNAEDVTKQYVDQSARLRNLHAQETQYLAILKQARTVHDTMEVSDKLNDVRGEIEQQQAEFDTLSKQVETVALTITLRAEQEAQVFGLHWRPLYELKIAARQGLDGIADYAATMAGFLFYIPAILLWLATVLIGAALAWRLLRWAGRILFARKLSHA
jgi:hypothetical protein